MDLVDAMNLFGHRKCRFPGIRPDDDDGEIELPFQRPSSKLEFVHTAEGMTDVIKENYWTNTNSAIHIAAVSGNTEVLLILLRHEQVEKLRNSLAVGYGTHTEIRSYIMGRRCRLTEDNPNLVQRLFGEPVESYDSDDDDDMPQRVHWRLFTPLQAALHARQDDCARMLVEHGAKLDFGPGPQGQAEHALHAAARNGCSLALEYLCSRPRVDINVPDVDGYTPLAHAVLSPYPSSLTLSILLRQGADVNAKLLVQGQYDDNFTHLHLACWHGQWRRAMQLLEAGADATPIYTRHYVPQYIQFPGPYRPIDLICIDNTPACYEHPDKNGVKLSPGTIEDRKELLTTIIRDHGANVFSTTDKRLSYRGSPITNIAHHLTAAMDLFLAVRDAGISLEGHVEVLRHVVDAFHETFQEEHKENFRTVLEWLLDQNVRLNSTAEKQEMFQAILTMVDSELKWTRDARDIERAANIIELLVKRGGMDPHFRGTVGWHWIDDREPGREPLKNCSLFRAFLLLECGELSAKGGQFLKMLVDCGAEPPELAEVVRDLMAWLLSERGGGTSHAVVCFTSLVARYLKTQSAEKLRNDLFGAVLEGGRKGDSDTAFPQLDQDHFVKVVTKLFDRVEVEGASPKYLASTEEFVALVRGHRDSIMEVIHGRS